MKQDKSETKNFICLQCGNCCRWAGFRYVLKEDKDRWLKEGRKDILKYVGEKTVGDCGEDAYTFTAYPVISDIKKGLDRKPCVFLKKKDKKYECSIHDTKPIVCREYPNDSLCVYHCNGLRKMIDEEQLDARVLIKQLMDL